MRARLLSIFCVVFFALAVRVYADQPNPVSGDLDFDWRNLVLSSGHSYGDIYSVGARAYADLTPSVSADVYATRVYNTNLVQEAVVQDEFSGGRVRAGFIRIPFGIYDTRETYGSGLINYPIPRGDYELDAVDWGVPGAMWIGGGPKLQVEAAAFNGIASSEWNTKGYAGGGAVRLQTYTGSVIIGLSRWDGYLSGDDQYSHRQVVQETGLDWRYTRPQLVMRGEIIKGDLAQDENFGWYDDFYYKIPGYGRWTAVARVEENHPEEPSNTAKQLTTGVRYVPGPGWDLAVNWIVNNGTGYYSESWSSSTSHEGNWLFQVFREIEF